MRKIFCNHFGNTGNKRNSCHHSHREAISQYRELTPCRTGTQRRIKSKWASVHDSEGVELFSSFNMLTLDVMLQCTCSYESNCQTAKEHVPYITAVYDLSRLVMERILYFPYYFDFIYSHTSSSHDYKKATKVVHEFAMDIITKRRKQLQGKTENDLPTYSKRRKYLDFIDVLLKAKDENGVGLSDEEIRAEVDTFVFEGHGSAAAGLSWTLYNLAIYPEHQQQCREEIDAIFAQKDSEELVWDDIGKMEYVGMCIKESLRLYPPVPVVGREMSQDIIFDGHVMPKGTKVAFSVYALHRHAGVWGDDAEEFKPLRFSTKDCKKRGAYCFVPFSAGPRNCIGQQFAMNEMKVAVAKILRRFTLMPAVEGLKPRKELSINLRAKKGIYLKIMPRY
ncbi:cytochrome P450 4F4-like isoform X2 [Dysidea avara]|uniref:cytochrome P450 4F4-like isoform X2 n=1 Tax=Dysidea avara TaxID=196820 RepID=UPI00332B3F7D